MADFFQASASPVATGLALAVAIEEPRSKLRGIFDRKEFCLI
jgi:hypothetical protein